MRPLRPGLKSFERGSTFASRRRRRHVDSVALYRFQRAAVDRDGERRCAVCGTRKWLAPHHVVPAQWLRRNFPALEFDGRNALALCRRCHRRHHDAAVRVPRSCLRDANLEFILEVGAEWLRDAFYPEQEGEAA